MHFNDTTHKISLAVLGITILYTLVYSGLTGLLLSSAVALIAAAFIDPLELVVALTVIFVLFYTFYLKKLLKNMEPFQDSGKTIVDRVAGIQSKYHQAPQALKNPRREPAGVYHPAIEGFADAGSKVAKEGESAASSSAPTQATQNQVDPDHAQAVSSSIENKDVEADELASATGTLFKKGKMPSDHLDGPHLDAGQTMMKAMEKFDSNTVGAMTEDTKKLLDTQQQLMGMLKNMSPVLKEGREILQTFSGMFGGGGGGGSGMPFKLSM